MNYYYRSTCHAAIVSLTLLLGACDGEQSGGNARPGDAVPEVGVMKLQPRSVPVIVSLPGRTLASGTSEIRPQVDGLIQERVFTEGSQVKKGDLLYQINPRSYQAALDSAKAALSRAEASVPSARALVERYQTLLEAKGVSKQDLDEAKAALLEAKSDVEAARAALETARIKLDYTRVTAPISGLISTSSVTEGALVTANQETALATIRQMDPLYVDLSESSTNMLRIHTMIARGSVQRGESRPKVVLQLEDGSDYAHEGSISSRESSVSASTDTVTVRASMPNPSYFLLAGLYVRAEVSLGSTPNVFLLPQRAVSRNVKGQATAMFIGKANKVETRLLNADEAYGDYWVVKDGIAAGDRLIVDGLQKVANGQTVTAVTVQLDDDGVTEAASAKSPSSPAATR